MKIAVISDTHDNLVNLKKALEYIQAQGIETLIHCGDIATMDTIRFLRDNFEGIIHIVPGNADLDPDEEKQEAPKLKDLYFYPAVGAVEIDGVKIGFTHEPWLAKQIAAENRYNIMFYGHTHDPWEETIGTTHVLNPGNIAGIRTQPTFALYDLQKRQGQLVLLHSIKD